MGCAVRPDKAVDAKICIIRLITKITSVFPLTLRFRVQSLVHPVPDESSLKAMMTTNGIPVIRQTAVAVSHRMGVFAHDQRALVFCVLDPFHQIMDLRIHGSNHIGRQTVEIFRRLPIPLKFSPQGSFIVKQTT